MNEAERQCGNLFRYCYQVVLSYSSSSSHQTSRLAPTPTTMKLSLVCLYLLLVGTTPTTVNGRLIRDFLKNDGEFEITLDFHDVPYWHRLRFFFPALLQWQNTIVGDVVDVNDERLPNFDPTDCGPYPSSIDDIYICVSYTSIDGPGGVVGGGYASLYRETYLPVAGSMVFDKDDVPSLRRDSKFRASILSEMGTVVCCC